MQCCKYPYIYITPLPGKDGTLSEKFSEIQRNAQRLPAVSVLFARNRATLTKTSVNFYNIRQKI